MTDSLHSEALLAAIVESSEDAIISKSLDGTILTWNRGAEQTYGYTAAEAIGQPMAMLLPEDRPNEESEILRRIRAGEHVDHFETVRRTRGGGRIDVSLTISPIRGEGGAVVGVSHVARTISDRKRLDEQFFRLAAIVESSDDAVVSKTLEGRILTWNRGAEAIYGYTAAEVIGRPMTLLLPADRPNEEQEILDRIRRGERVRHFETVRQTKAGDLIDVSLTISPIQDATGRVIGASHIGRNITERRKLDEQMRHTQKLESLGILAGGVAHDFNNLLTGILGNASLALETLPEESPARELLEVVLGASERASDLTRQLLAYSGKGRLVVEPTNLSNLVREISNLIQTSIPWNVKLCLEMGEDLPLIQADSGQLQQVIMNLVINGAEAVAAASEGKVYVTTTVHDVTSQTSAELPPGRYVSMEVRDTGTGMDERTLKRIFDPFFTTKVTGRGLGLAAVQGIVRGHKGVMTVASRQGEGTLFRLLFPATDAPESRQAAAQKGSYDSVSKELILVIDDEDTVRRTAKSILEFHGYRVVTAESGREGASLYGGLGEKIAAVLLDTAMRAPEGQEAVRLLRAVDPHIKVILASGSNLHVPEEFTAEGVSGFIQKPYTTAVLLKQLRTAIDGIPGSPPDPAAA